MTLYNDYYGYNFCEKCQYGTHDWSNWEKHLKTKYHKRILKDNDETRNTRWLDRPKRCSKCDHTFRNHGAYLRHLKTIKHQYGDCYISGKYNRCEICNKSISSQNLSRHRKTLTHSQKTTELRNKVSNLPMVLQNHINSFL